MTILLLLLFSVWSPAPDWGPSQLTTARLVRELGHDAFEERCRASLALAKLGSPAHGELLRGLDSADVEVARRCEAILLVSFWSAPRRHDPQLRPRLHALCGGQLSWRQLNFDSSYRWGSAPRDSFMLDWCYARARRLLLARGNSLNAMPDYYRCWPLEMGAQVDAAEEFFRQLRRLGFSRRAVSYLIDAMLDVEAKRDQ